MPSPAVVPANSNGNTLYRLRRDSVGTRIELGRLRDQAGLARTTDEEIDAILDVEG